MTRSEVDALVSEGSVEESTVFGPLDEDVFSYRIEKGDGNIVSAGFRGGRMTVAVPAAIVDEWAAADQLGFSGRQMLEDGSVLDILVEKDLTCLKPREGEDESDNFPNPDVKNSC
jgi:hypothetical protein